MKTKTYIFWLWCMCLLSGTVKGQQDPQYTQYMYNTMAINPGYASAKDHTSFVALARTQWVGFSGAPETQTLSFQTPLGTTGLGLGINVINDILGPSQETIIEGNLAYRIRTSTKGNLALGFRVGGRMLNLDWSKGRFQQPDAVFNENINNRFLPSLGVGIYYFESNWYAGISVPNFLKTDHYSDLAESVAEEKLHYFIIAGYVFDLTNSIKFKPAILSKIVSGAPISMDLSANFLWMERFTLGMAYRWNDAISALAGLQVNERLFVGYSYDLTTSNFQNYNSGTHEALLRYNIFKQPKLKSPRFF
ncbi:type IX secretion system membrane protein PorP/SprF [Flavobacteriaceae bacterium S356]|uniref:Type IX secretion system membrane protein PorP/SprF n=1 Tax=Asprobacillus argus TaxID=3076534 RepID=A0ABU3LJ88_9FLAO|nr:type IX secretion system membrane protein PorP/SprF [Flavobacteriaceae bacterium S356]